MFNYAQLDASGLVVGISSLSGEVHSPNMVLVASADEGLIGTSYNTTTGEFSDYTN